MPNPPFRMRIRDLAAGKTIAEKFDDKPEVVAKYIASFWVLRYRRDTCEWVIQIWTPSFTNWRDLTSQERKLMETLIESRRG